MILRNNNPHFADSLLKVLIVEDHAAVRESLRECVQSSFPDALFLEADSGEDALKLAAEKWPQIVLMDISLPGMDGIETTRGIRARVPGSYVVMVSIHEDDAHRVAATKAGAAAFVAKRNLPGNLMQLLERVVPYFSPPDETLHGLTS